MDPTSNSIPIDGLFVNYAHLYSIDDAGVQQAQVLFEKLVLIRKGFALAATLDSFQLDSVVFLLMRQE